MNFDFIIYYDLAQNSFNYLEVGLWAFFLFIGAIIFIWMPVLVGNQGKVFRWIGIGVSAIFWGNIRRYDFDLFLRKTLATNESEIAEGKIENFIPRPIHGHAMESFTVQGKKFEYSDGVNDIGFNRTVAAGGSILREGMYVRIHHYGNHILRLEIRKDDYTAATAKSAR